VANIVKNTKLFFQNGMLNKMTERKKKENTRSKKRKNA
jgi:hypothetical protein